jgi:hypothetical protein
MLCWGRRVLDIFYQMEIFKNIFHLLFNPKSSANTQRKLTWLEHFLQESNIIITNIAIERYGKATDSPSH